MSKTVYHYPETIVKKVDDISTSYYKMAHLYIQSLKMETKEMQGNKLVKVKTNVNFQIRPYKSSRNPIIYNDKWNMSSVAIYNDPRQPHTGEFFDMVRALETEFKTDNYSNVKGKERNFVSLIRTSKTALKYHDESKLSESHLQYLKSIPEHCYLRFDKDKTKVTVNGYVIKDFGKFFSQNYKDYTVTLKLCVDKLFGSSSTMTNHQEYRMKIRVCEIELLYKVQTFVPFGMRVNNLHELNRKYAGVFKGNYDEKPLTIEI